MIPRDEIEQVIAALASWEADARRRCGNVRTVNVNELASLRRMLAPGSRDVSPTENIGEYAADAVPRRSGEPAETRAAVNIAAWKCKHCGCIWRDNLDGTVSLFDAQQQSCRECEESTPHACVIHWIEMAETRAVLPAQNMEEWAGRSPIDATYDPVLPQCYVDDITAPLVVCERCQMRLPEQLVTFGVGVRGGTVARCAACAPQPGPEGDAKRAEVIALRKAKRALSPDTDTAPS